MRGDTLIETFSAGTHAEHTAPDRLCRDRQMRRTRHKIDDKASEYRYFTGHYYTLTFF